MNSGHYMSAYLETIGLIERLHRRCLEVVKTELDRASVRDINNIQSLIIYNIGEEELTVGELTLRGCYHGSNVSYNLKKLVEYGYVSHERSSHDRRSYRVKLTEKGHEVRQLLQAMFRRHSTVLNQTDMSEGTLGNLNDTLQKVDRFWSAAASGYTGLEFDLGNQD